MQQPHYIAMLVTDKIKGGPSAVPWAAQGLGALILVGGFCHGAQGGSLRLPTAASASCTSQLRSQLAAPLNDGSSQWAAMCPAVQCQGHAIQAQQLDNNGWTDSI